ncbi:MAG: Trm112 family protein [Chloroflexi bacterium]|nr:Trm112 family protein [Chloroflexota bacterium]
MARTVSKELLEILACPVCKTAVELRGDFIECDRCGRRFPVRDGIPVMLVEEGDKNRREA